MGTPHCVLNTYEHFRDFRNEIRKEVRKAKLYYSSSGWRYVEVPKGCSKGFLVYILAAYFHISTSELAEHFNISEKTIKDYIRYWRKSHRYIEYRLRCAERSREKLKALSKSRRPMRESNYYKVLLHIAESRRWMSIDELHDAVGGLRKQLYQTLEKYHEWGLLLKTRCRHKVHYALREKSVMYRKCPQCEVERPLRFTGYHESGGEMKYRCVACESDVDDAMIVSFSKRKDCAHMLVYISHEVLRTEASSWSGVSVSLEDEFMILREGSLKWWHTPTSKEREIGLRFSIKYVIPQLIGKRCPAYYNESEKTIIVDLASQKKSERVRELF